MDFDFNVYSCDYDKKSKLLLKDSTGVVKCKKAFPIYNSDGREYIFKPLSKTKPFTTPLFGFSEVFWSTVIKRYFDENAPLYRLAICNGYSDHHPNRYSKGTIVESIVGDGERLVDLLEHFQTYPDDSVDIQNYINYCGMYYDYTSIINSSYFSERPELGMDLARQILISILRNDINYHYENIVLKYGKDGKEIVAPPIDHEFSVPFLFPDDPRLYTTYFGTYNLTLMQGSIVKTSINLIAILDNINLIAKKYPDTAFDFLRRLESFIRDFSEVDLTLPEDYMEPLSTELYQVYEAIYKDHEDSPELHEIPKFRLSTIDIKDLSAIIQRDILFSAINYYSYLESTLKSGHVFIKGEAHKK